MHCACGFDNETALLTKLISGAVDPLAHSNCALQRACRKGWEGVARWLLRDGRSDPAAYDGAAVRWACYLDRMPIVRLFVATCDTWQRRQGRCRATRRCLRHRKSAWFAVV